MSGHHAVVEVAPFFAAWLSAAFVMLEGLRRWHRRLDRERES